MTSAAEVEYLENNSTNLVYLITYSQLDIRKFLRQSFGAACALAVGREKHASSGAHYDVSIHPKSPGRWLS